MSKFMKKLKRSIVMMLVCALVAGSVPVNGYAAEIDQEIVLEEQVQTTADEVVSEAEVPVSELREEVSEAEITENMAGLENGEDLGMSASDNVISEEDVEDETLSENEDAYLEETISVNEETSLEETVSENDEAVSEEVISEEEELVLEETVSENDTEEMEVQESETEQNVQKTVSLFFDDDQVVVTNATMNGVKFWDLVALGDDLEETPARQANVPYGSKLTITVEAWGNTVLTGIQGTGVKTQNLKDLSSYTFTVEVKQDIEVKIASEAKTGIYVFEEDDVEVEEGKWESTYTPLETEKNVYTLDNVWYKDYVAFVYEGNDFETPVKVKEAKLLQGNTPVKWGVVVRDNEEISISGNCVPGKTYQLKVTTEKGVETSTTLKTLPLISKVTVNGVKSGKLTQSADTTKEYEIKITPKGALNTVGVEVESNDNNVISSAEMVNGKLLLVTSQNVGSATLKLYDKVSSNYIDGGTFDVNVTAPKMTTVKPTVKLAGSNNTSFTLSLGAKGIETANNSKVWYKVVATPVDTYEDLGKVTKYFAYEGETQTATVRIGEKEEGSIPKALKYNIEVSMVQVKEEEHPESENTQILFETVSNKVAKLNNAATKKPYYETNLKLKKGTTTVYTGQRDVVVATAVFSKLTSYTDNMTIEVLDKWGEGVFPENGITARYADGKVYVSVADDAEFNSYYNEYQVKVTADTTANTKTSSATMSFKVVYGINYIEFSTPNTIYKADKKAASFKVDYTAYHGMYYDEEHNYYPNVYYPHKNKVNLSIVDNNGNELTEDHPLKKYVSVKNGKVTVAKDYVIDPYAATFYIKAEAADYEGNSYTTISDPITITNQKMELGEVVLAKYQEDSYGYEIVARSGDTVSIDKVKYSEVRVLKKDVAEKDVYAWDDFIDWMEVSIKCSNKNVNFDAGYGSIYGINKEAKNVKFTVTAKDGSGAKAELNKLNIVGTQEELGLHICNYNNWENINTVSDDGKNYSGTFYGVKRTPIYFEVGIENGDSLYGYAAPKCKVTFDGVNVMYSYTKNGYYEYAVEPKGETVVATLEYGNTKKVYTLTNASFGSDIKELASVELEGMVHQYNYNKVNLVLPEEYNGQYVVISPDQMKWEKDSKYREFTWRINELDRPIPVAGNKAEFTVQTPQKDGSYKLYVTVGTLDENNNFIASTKEKEITVKVNKVKIVKNTSKLTSAYTIDVSKGTSVNLTYTNKNNAYGYALYNTNDNGTPNNFADYFELNGTVLKLKDTLTKEQKAYLLTEEAKKDLTGWIDYYNSNGMQTSKVKVTLKGSFPDGSTGDGGKDGPFHFEVIIKSFQSEYWQGAVTGISKACAEFGLTANVNGPANEFDIADQVQMLDAAIEVNPDGIGLAACDTYAVMDSFTVALEKGIPVVCFDTPIYNVQAVKSNVSMDQMGMGSLAAEKIYTEVADKIASATVEHPVRIGEVNQDATSYNIQNRGLGFINKMIELCNAAGKKVKVEGNEFYINASSGAVASNAEVIIEVGVPAQPAIDIATTEANKIMSKEDTIAIWGSSQIAAECIITANMTLNVLGKNTTRQMIAAGADSGIPQKVAINSGQFIGAVSTDIVEQGYECIKTLKSICQGNRVNETLVDGLWYDATNMEDVTIKPNLYN